MPGPALSPSKPSKEKQSQAIEFARLISDHAPPDWKEWVREARLKGSLSSDKPLSMIVLAADIRKSTLVMKEATRFSEFADTLNGFVLEATDVVRRNGGWWDKFTGDGFLAYWIHDDKRMDDAAHQVFETCSDLLEYFKSETLPSFRSNSKNWPAGVGLSFGVDAGRVYLMSIANQPTIVGPTVVGAVRMVQLAKVGETVCNVYLGETLFDIKEHFRDDHHIDITREMRQTKEYEEQEVYPVTFHGHYRRGHLDDEEDVA